MNKVIGYVVCGIDYEDHVNDRAYLDRGDAETRMQHLTDVCGNMPTWPSNYPEECNAIEAWEQLERDQEKFCKDNDYPRNMDNITKFRIEEIEIYGSESIHSLYRDAMHTCVIEELGFRTTCDEPENKAVAVFLEKYGIA